MTGSDWALGPFTREGEILKAGTVATFRCPVTGRQVTWAAKDLFNPGAVVHDGKVALLVRGEDEIGRYSGTSRVGLATSTDGLHFEVEQEPVLFPADDAWQAWEWPGGCEDPRVVERPDGGYVCTYTAFDGKAASLFVATSDDLRVWTKHGPAFAGTAYERRWTKSGAILTEVHDGRLVAANVDGRFWMHWGEGTVFGATSTDLIRWQPVEFDPGADRYLSYPSGWQVHRVTGSPVLQPMMSPRHGRFDSLLVEPGPPPVLTDDGVVLLYNGANHPRRGDATSPAFAYQPGQALFDGLDPTALLARKREPFLRVEGVGESVGQVGNVCFAQGLVLFEDRWLLYFGMADSRIGCASAVRS